jgi:hypothetical protein
MIGEVKKAAKAFERNVFAAFLYKKQGEQAK